MPSLLEAAIRESRRRIAEGEAPIRAMLADAYTRTLRNLDADLMLVTRMIEEAREQGIEVNPDWLRRQDRYIRLMNQAEREFTRFADDGMRIIEQGRIRAVRGGAAEAWELLDASGIAQGFGGRINTLAVENALAAAYDGPLRRVFARYGDEGAQTITDTLLGGMAQGHSPRRIVRDIQRGLRSPANTARLEATVRTEFMRANRAGMDEQYSRMAHLIKGYRWSAAKSIRTCLACLGQDGKIRPQPWDQFHVQCRCISTPVAKGGTYQYETGEEWLRRQPESTQRRMLPSMEAFTAYRDGRVGLADFVGTHTDKTWGRSVYQRSGRQTLELAAKRPTAAKPKRIAKLKPAGQKIDEAFEIYAPDPKHRKKIDTATKSINKVHGQQDLPQIPLESDVNNWTGSASGMYRQQGDKPFDILIDDKRDLHTELTTVHEIGHFIDHMGLGTPGIHSSSAGELAQWSTAVRNSRTYKRLEEIRGMDRIEYIDPFFNQPTSLRVDKVFLDYTMSDEELFARSYAQFIAQRSGNKTLLNQVESGRGIRPDAPTIRDDIIPTQWEEDDFAEIDAAFVELFRALGWMK